MSVTAANLPSDLPFLKLRKNSQQESAIKVLEHLRMNFDKSKNKRSNSSIQLRGAQIYDQSIKEEQEEYERKSPRQQRVFDKISPNMETD